MGAQVSWEDDEHTIMRVVYTEPWRTQDIYDALEEITRMLDSVPHKVAIIVDVRSIKSIPRGVLKALYRVVSTDRPNEEMYYIVGANSVVRAIYNAAKTIYPAIGKLVTFASSIEEVPILIEEHRSKNTE
ncbi:MAG: hypothetical protein D6712_14690 [Chloroflexi bacterium]|nr:MAG: hypothetical protein D6712_14690 [Chloroflexota bacterium]